VSTAAPARLLRIGFLGAGWIGRHRMLALARSGLVDPVAVADPDRDAVAAAVGELPGEPLALRSLDELLDVAPDGVVIATPSALHAQQARAALERGVAVFCQKPLARTAAETETVVAAARRADRLLGVDLSYRHTAAITTIEHVLDAGSLGDLYAAELVFHNAYGPDKAWFTQRRLAGGGCLIDLGTHLLDLLLRLTGSDSARVEAARLLHRGGAPTRDQVEDFATVQLRTSSGVSARLACSWFLPIGRDCEIEVTLYGNNGSVSLRNVAGSFYDFTVHRCRGTRCEQLAAPPDDWGGRAITAWARRLASSRRYDPTAEELHSLAGLIDDIYAHARIDER
jgi:predicted dehydrogenase